MKPGAWVGIIIIIAALAYGARAFVSGVTPYVTFDQARRADSTVQVMGALDKSSIQFGSGTLDFRLVEKTGDKLPVVFAGSQPADFRMATQVTAIGRYDGHVFQADNILVKCPSKYQGQPAATPTFTAPAGVDLSRS